LTEQRAQQPDAAVTILNTSGMNDRVQQQTLHVDENMSFLAFDQLACIEPVRINAGPPFSGSSRSELLEGIAALSREHGLPVLTYVYETRVHAAAAQMDTSSSLIDVLARGANE
jgi:cytosine/adenosine deaminase-related metal-dependent hydrolase